jgi:hypothetical protein
LPIFVIFRDCAEITKKGGHYERIRFLLFHEMFSSTCFSLFRIRRFVLELAITMGLEFPNPSRSYDPDNKRVRFTGHDGMFEIAFSIEVDALSKNTFAASEAEAGYLKAFDAASRFVREIARTAYERTTRHSYALTAADIKKS